MIHTTQHVIVCIDNCTLTILQILYFYFHVIIMFLIFLVFAALPNHRLLYATGHLIGLFNWN